MHVTKNYTKTIELNFLDLFNREELKYAFCTEKSYEKVALEILGTFYTHQPRQINSSCCCSRLINVPDTSQSNDS